MVEAIRDRLRRLRVGELLRVHPGLRLRPMAHGELKIAGTIGFAAEPPGLERIGDRYEVEISVPAAVYSLIMFLFAALWGTWVSRRVTDREGASAL